MPSLVVFLVLLVGPVLIAIVRHRDIVSALIDGVAFATTVTLIVFGPEVPLPYVAKAALIALGAGVWVWSQMRRPVVTATADLRD